jgi:hypothetical protein
MLEGFAAPPPKGELAAAIAALAERAWHHPISDAHTRFGFSTIERWYYRAFKEKRDPVAVLRRKLRADAGQQPAMSGAVRQAITAQYATHKSRSVRLHHDNLLALAENNPDLGPVPSYATQRRFLRASGFNKRRRLTSRRTEGAERAEAPFLDRETRQSTRRPSPLRCASWLADGAHARGRVGDADPVRRTRRPLAPCLSPAMVSVCGSGLGRIFRQSRP